jgi:very-short-patch-repair endonuclease
MRRKGEGVTGYTGATLVKAQSLRSQLTDAERKLWSALRNRQLSGAKFRRQQPIGPFIADFVCQAQRLIVEADGGQHAESIIDERRTAFLESRGYRVLRFWNNDILSNIDGVAQVIAAALSSPHPAQAALESPSPSRGEGIGDSNA